MGVGFLQGKGIGVVHSVLPTCSLSAQSTPTYQGMVTDNATQASGLTVCIYKEKSSRICLQNFLLLFYMHRNKQFHLIMGMKTKKVFFSFLKSAAGLLPGLYVS